MLDVVKGDRDGAEIQLENLLQEIQNAKCCYSTSISIMSLLYW